MAPRPDPTSVPGPLPSVWIQTILFRHSAAEFDRFISGIKAAVNEARRHGCIGSVALVAGDCSPNPVVADGDVAEHSEALQAAGIDRFEYRFFGANLGSAGGHNELLHGADFDLVVIVNPDVYVSPSLITELCAPLEDPEVGIVEARQVPMEHPKEFDRVTGTTSWASTACAVVRREVAQSVGGFDAHSFFLYCDDVDFSWRVRLAGYRVVYQPTATVFHDKRLDTAGQVQVGDAEVYYSAEASLMMAWKYSRPDLVTQWSEGLLGTGSPQHLRAVETFRQRNAAGTLPAPLDAEGSVSQFIGYTFGQHRFAYDE